MYEDKGQNSKPSDQEDDKDLLPWTGVLSGRAKQLGKTDKEGHTGNESESETGSAQNSWQTKPEKIGRDRIIELILAAAIAGATVVQLYTVIDNNHAAGKQAERLLDTANRMDDAADSFSTSSATISRGVGDAVEKLNLQAEKLDSSVQQASRLAAATEKANANVLENDRPWVGISMQIEKPELGKIPTEVISMVNTGKRPAKIILSEHAAHFFVRFPDDPPYKVSSPPSMGILMPNILIPTTYNLFGEPALQKTLDDLVSGTETFYVYAKVDYVDVQTGKSHHTHMCVRYQPATKALAEGFINCTEYQDAD